MKRALIVFVFFPFLFSLGLQAQNSANGYEEAMEEALLILDQARDSLEEYQKAANAFARIGKVAEGEWQPPYYEAYAHLMVSAMTMRKGGTIEGQVDAAQEALDKAKAIAPENSEVLALQGYVYQGRIWEDWSNAPVFSPQSTIACKSAIELDPDNPRPYFLIGQNYFYMPEAFGGGKATAQPWLEKAAERFEQQGEREGLEPVWGSYNNQYLLKQCQAEGKE